MDNLSIEGQFSLHPTSAISDALDEKGINGSLYGVYEQRYGQGRVVGRAMPVKFSKKSSDPNGSNLHNFIYMNFKTYKNKRLLGKNKIDIYFDPISLI